MNDNLPVSLFLIGFGSILLKILGIANFSWNIIILPLIIATILGIIICSKEIIEDWIKGE